MPARRWSGGQPVLAPDAAGAWSGKGERGDRAPPPRRQPVAEPAAEARRAAGACAGTRWQRVAATFAAGLRAASEGRPGRGQNRTRRRACRPRGSAAAARAAAASRGRRARTGRRGAMITRYHSGTSGSVAKAPARPLVDGLEQARPPGPVVDPPAPPAERLGGAVPVDAAGSRRGGRRGCSARATCARAAPRPFRTRTAAWHSP